MKAGPELDLLVAEKVMGLGKLPLDSLRPCYSTNIVCAWDVVEKLHNKPEEFNFILDLCMNEYEATFTAGDSNCSHSKPFDVLDGHGFTHVEAEAKTAPLAICLAALKACEN